MAMLDEIISIQLTGSIARKRCVKTAIPVAGRPFAQYISYRLIKDNLGFVPIQDRWQASTQPGSHITSVIPESIEDLLVYFHELGHNKSKQPQRAYRGFFGGISHCNGTITCEYNAWVWALKYFRRLGYALTDSCKEVVKKSFQSYIDNAENDNHASVLASKLSKTAGIDITIAEKAKITFPVLNTPTIGWDWADCFKPNKTTEFSWYDEVSSFPVQQKPKGHKPWHDLKQKQMKKAWKHQR